MRGGGEMFQKNLPISPGPRMAILEWNVSGRHRQQHHPQHPHQHRCRDWRWLLGPSRRRKQATWNVDFMAGQPMSPPVHQKFQVSKMEGFLNPIAGKAKDVFVRCNLCRSISNKKRTHWLAYTYPIYIYIYVCSCTLYTYIYVIYVCVVFVEAYLLNIPGPHLHLQGPFGFNQRCCQPRRDPTRSPEVVQHSRVWHPTNIIHNLLQKWCYKVGRYYIEYVYSYRWSWNNPYKVALQMGNWGYNPTYKGYIKLHLKLASYVGWCWVISPTYS